MVTFYEDEKCTKRLSRFTLEESYIEDMFGGVISNVVEVGTTVEKVIYIKNEEADTVVIKDISSESPFMSLVPENVVLEPGQVTALRVTFSPTKEEIEKLNKIKDEQKREARKRKLLRSDIKVQLARVII